MTRKNCARWNTSAWCIRPPMAAMNNGDNIEIKAGEFFYIAPGDDSWVIGAEPYVSAHFLEQKIMQSTGSSPSSRSARMGKLRSPRFKVDCLIVLLCLELGKKRPEPQYPACHRC
jgi:hypothetical protein